MIHYVDKYVLKLFRRKLLKKLFKHLQMADITTIKEIVNFIHWSGEFYILQPLWTCFLYDRTMFYIYVLHSFKYE